MCAGWKDRFSSSRLMRDLIRDHLRGVVGLLSGFVLASAVVVIADAPAWSRIVAALLALVSLSLVVAWLQLPWAEWTASRARRLVFATAPMVAAGFVLGLGVILSQGASSAVFSDPATLILLDASEGMGEELEGGASKFAEATRELRRHVRDLGNDQLGLAAFGIPSCDSEGPPIDERVSVAHDRAGQIRKEAEELRPAGKANLVSAGRNAVGLLNPFQDERRRLLVITGGLDACGGDLGELLSESKVKGVAVQWELVGLGFTGDEKEQAGELPDNVRVHLADTSAELDDVFKIVLFEEPIRDELDKLLQYVQTEIREPLSGAISAINSTPPRAREARTRLAELRRLAEKGEERFGEFATEDERSVFMPVEDLLRRQFELLQQGAAAVEDVVKFDESHAGELSEQDIGERNELIGRVSAPVSSYNASLTQLVDRIEDALDELFGGG